LVKEKKLHLVFLMETKMILKRIDFLRIKLKFNHMFVVNSVGQSGGLALLLIDDFYVDIQNFSPRQINYTITLNEDGGVWKFTGFYGHLDSAKRYESWVLLRYLATLPPEPWLCMGDFNEILEHGKKWGEARRARWLIEYFKGALEDCF
jgi:hypothetical protein